MSSTSEVSIRPATVNDLGAISSIHRHYVLNTSATFTEKPLPPDIFITKHAEIVSQDLPYIVAQDDSSKEILAYANAHSFRGSKGAYRHTAEITLFCHPEHTSKGIGSRLIESLLDALVSPDQHPELFLKPPRGGENSPLVKELLAVMSVDPAGKRDGLALRDFYQRHGFKLVGHLRRVGFKFDKWIDTMYLQKSL